jgi:hypothetical protein
VRYLLVSILVRIHYFLQDPEQIRRFLELCLNHPIVYYALVFFRSIDLMLVSPTRAQVGVTGWKSQHKKDVPSQLEFFVEEGC